MNSMAATENVLKHVPWPCATRFNAFWVSDREFIQDGLPDEVERDLETDPPDPDTDGDRLTDGTGVLFLGTSPTSKDSDEDGIHDSVEVQGFSYNDQEWYLNRLNPDTNGDSQPDGAECPDLAGVTTAPATVNCDTDGDTTPDLFDYDDDGDGVPDRVDLSPNSVLDRNGKRSGKGTITPFDADNPFRLKVEGPAAAFVPGRDCEDDDPGNNPDYVPDEERCHSDGKRDIVVADGNHGNSTIFNRLDSTGSVPNGDVRRWGIPQTVVSYQ